MGIELTPKQEIFVQEKLASGGYSSVSDVLQEAFDALSERNHDARSILAHRELIEKSLDEADRGEFTDETFDEIIESTRRERFGSVA